MDEPSEAPRGESDEPKVHEGEGAAKDEPQGDPAPSDAGAPQTLSLLFFAAAAGLLLLLALIGVIAFAAMSR